MPTMTNGTPQSTKKPGALPELATVVSQTMANPHHRMLNGIVKTSELRKTTPWRGRPHQRACSPGEIAARISSGSLSWDFDLWRHDAEWPAAQCGGASVAHPKAVDRDRPVVAS